MKNALKILKISAVVLLCAAVATLVWIGTNAPARYIYEGQETPSEYIEKVKELGLVEEDETIEFLYSDTLFKLEESVFVFTDSKMALHSNGWKLAKVLVPYQTITKLAVDYDDPVAADSIITLVATGGSQYTFPLSPKKGLDKKVVALIEQRSGVTATVLSDE